MISLFDENYRALVIGASGAIGKAFVCALQADVMCSSIELVSRSDNHGFDLLDTASIEAQAGQSAGGGPYHLIVDATGVLTIDGVGPEKSLAAVQPDLLAKAFQLNAIGPLMVLRHFAPLLASGPCIYAKLSARVGSITDNQKGGWYGYRASKAALNMLFADCSDRVTTKKCPVTGGCVAARYRAIGSVSVPFLLVLSICWTPTNRLQACCPAFADCIVGKVRTSWTTREKKYPGNPPTGLHHCACQTSKSTWFQVV